ncbi:sugar transferase [Longispora albida]|uniref:sugar transferase n=1 Tax=Longispora albida TaxID=203523 RepID=UPI000381BA8B|nr:sugar transferase [Longispora albida]
MTTYRIPGNHVGRHAAPGWMDVRPGAVGKRAFDLTFAALLVVVLSPVLLAAWLVVRGTSPGAAVFRQYRLGLGGRPFEMYKFRTMTAGCDDKILRDFVAQELQQDKPPVLRDPRVTAAGRWLRASSIDELPQLFNVLRGQMSLIGPRPMLDWELDMMPGAYRRRLAVLPGITGLWQVSGRNQKTLTERLDLDLEYVDRRSFALDLLILARTVRVVILRVGAQ